MKTIKKTKEYIYQINGSKFISICFYVEEISMINDILSKLKSDHRKAKHICFAYKIDDKQKFSDDNEPQNTAGKKILETILINKLHNILIVVIRYMNGTKLGVGLLSRSYYHSSTLVTNDLKNICDLSLINIYKITIELQRANSIIEYLAKNKEIIFNKTLNENNLIIETSLNNQIINNFENPIFIKKTYIKKTYNS